MNDLQIFDCAEFGEVRAVVIGGEPWFVASDVARALGYANPAEAVRDHCKKVNKINHHSNSLSPPTNYNIISEGDIYRLIIRSHLPEAEKFERKVMEEILPSIRRTGGYLAAPADASPEEIMARALFVADDTIKRLKASKAALESKIETDRPKVIFADAVTASPKSILVRELAKYLKQNGVDIGQNRLFAWFREEGYLIKAVGLGYNEPTQRAMNLGLFEIKKHTFVHSDGLIDAKKSVRVTGKGQLYFVNKFLGGAKAASN